MQKPSSKSKTISKTSSSTKKSGGKAKRSKSARSTDALAHPVVTPPKPGVGEPEIRYIVSMPEPWTHNIEVKLEIDWREAGSQDIALRMPAWTPGSYKIREFARNVSNFQAVDENGKPLAITRSDKDTWQIARKDCAKIIVTYRVYAFEFSVRTPHMDDTHCFFQPSNALVALVDHTHLPCLLEIHPWGDWQIACSLPLVKGSGHIFWASDYDILVDSPVECGNHETRSFVVDGKLHEIAVYGWGNYDLDQWVKDFKAIVVAAKSHFGGKLPYEHYLFILHCMPNTRGGLEHLNSQVSAWDSNDFLPRERYEEFLSLISHEFWHTWNVKRIRPEILGPWDYSREQYTSELWVMEGFTVYYEWLVLVRAGVVSRERFFESWAGEFRRWQDRPGNDVMALDESSFLAWTKLYLADEDFVNTGISYYLKGALVALCLEMELRETSGGKVTLDDVMSTLYQRFGWPKPGFPEGEVQRIVEELTGKSWKSWFRRHLSETKPLKLEKALRTVGLETSFAKVYESGADGVKREIKEKAWAGWELDDSQGKLEVKMVRIGSPASDAGMSGKDELIAINGQRTPNIAAADKVLKLLNKGDVIRASVFRGERLLHCDITLDARPAGQLLIGISERATPAQVKQLDDWLTLPNKR